MLPGVTDGVLRVRRPTVVWLAVGWVAIADSLRRVGAQGAATVLTAALLVMSFMVITVVRESRRYLREEPLIRPKNGAPAALYLFAIWVAFDVVIVGMTSSGVQNVLVYSIFILSVATTASLSSEGTALWLLRGLRIAATVACCLWLPTVATTGIGTDGFLVARAAADGSAIVGLVASLGLPRVRTWEKIAPWFLLLVIALTLSRLTIAVGAVLLLATVLIGRGRPDGRAIAGGLGVGLAGYLLATRFEPLQARFEQNDGASLLGVQVGTTGRDNLWSTLISRSTDPVFGQGVGAAQDEIARVFVRITQPHNDYLRLFYDLGWPGMLLWIAALLVLTGGAVRRLQATPNGPGRAIHLAAAAAGLTILVYAGFNNIIIGVGSMLPFGAIMGASIAQGVATHSRKLPPRRANQPPPQEPAKLRADSAEQDR
jgi:hypothetical protein